MRAKTWTGGIVIGALAAIAAAAVVTSAGAREDVREIHLTARGMAFYLDADVAAVNPVLQLRPGERVRVIVRNQTPGMIHDFAVQSLGVQMKALNAGDVGVVDFHAPAQSGRYEYHCTPHAAMMKGQLVIR